MTSMEKKFAKNLIPLLQWKHIAVVAFVGMKDIKIYYMGFNTI